MSEIVLAIRLGPESEAPTGVAVQLARDTRAHVTVLFVLAELDAIEVGAAAAGMDPGQEHERVLAEAESGLNAFLAAHLAGVPASGRLERGKVEEVVTGVAAELNARFIVVGTRGRGALARLVLGDVVQGILQRTPCPVIVVPLGEAQG
jgi:nucleotide-binding universal stress UspA family protein